MQSDADNRTTFNDVNLTGAKIKGKLDMSGASSPPTISAISTIPTPARA
jgi:hypothetical protein